MAEEGSDDAQAAQADLVMPNVSRPAARTHPRRMDDGDTTRTILSPTAFVRARGELTLNAIELGTYELDYGLTPGVQIGARTGIPLRFLSVGVNGKAPSRSTVARSASGPMPLPSSRFATSPPSPSGVDLCVRWAPRRSISAEGSWLST